MTTSIYPGSFNPWHVGHQYILEKALQVFDRVQIAVGQNPDKPTEDLFERIFVIERSMGKDKYKRVNVVPLQGLLVDHIKIYPDIKAIVRGLRHGKDLEDERLQQYWNEDLAKEGSIYLPPTIYFVVDRNLIHISSSAIRIVDKLKKGRK